MKMCIVQTRFSHQRILKYYKSLEEEKILNIEFNITLIKIAKSFYNIKYEYFDKINRKSIIIFFMHFYCELKRLRLNGSY